MDLNMVNMVVDEKYHYTGRGFEEKLPSGIASFDIALGGGIPLNGSIIEIYGEEGHGKTTLSYRLCKKCTDLGGYVTWIDNETSYDSVWAQIQGVNTERLVPYRPPFMEAAMDLIRADIKMYKKTFLPWLAIEDGRSSWSPSKELAEKYGLGVRDLEGIKARMIADAPPHLIVWDSLAAAPVKSMVEGEEFAQGMAYRARLIKSFLSRYMTDIIDCDKIGMILINQIIDNIGDQWNPITTPGGRGLRHGKHLSIFVKKSGSGEKDSDNFKTTDYVMLSITKNKVTPVIASLPVIFSKSRGFLGSTSVLEYLWNIGWFTSAGSWKKFKYFTTDPETGELLKEEDISFQRGTFYDLIEKRPELFTYLCTQILRRFSEKFPGNQALLNTNVDAVVQACLAEDTSKLSQAEVESLGE